MSYRKNTRKKIIAGILAIVMLVQVAVSTFASDELDSSDYEALGSSTSATELGSSETPLGLSIAPMGMPFATNDITIALSNNAPANGFQSYTTGFGAAPPELVTSLTIAVKKANILNGKIELDFASKNGHLGTSFFTYDRIGALPASTIFAGAPTVDLNTGKITLLLKDNVALNSTEGISIFHKYNTAEYDGGAAPASVLADLSAKAFVGAEKVYETGAQQVKAVNLGRPYFVVQYFYPNDGGTAAVPSVMSNRDSLSIRQTLNNNDGLFANKFDSSENVAIKTYLPNGTILASGGGSITQNHLVTPAEAAVIGVPAGTYALHHNHFGTDGRTSWNINYGSDINRNFGTADVTFKLPDDSNGKTYAIYRQASFKHLGAAAPTYRPVVTQYVKVDNSLGWKLILSGVHGTGGSASGYSGIENGDMGDSDISTGWGYTHTSSQKNVGSVNATQVEKILTQSGAGPARINFDRIRFFVDRANSSVPITPIEYYFVIGSDKGHTDYTTAVQTSAVVETYMNLPTLDPAKGEYIKSVHTSPVVGGVKGIWPPGTSLRYVYKLKAWPDKTWPDGSTVNPGKHPVKIAWKLNYFSPTENDVLSVNSEATYRVGYISGAPTPWAKGAGVPGTTPGSVSPGEEILYRINGYNYVHTAKTTWDDPTVIMRLPAGITLAETTGIQLMNAGGVSQGAVTVTGQGEHQGMHYYRLQAPAGYKTPISASPSFYIDVKLKLPDGIAQGNYQPSFALTNLDSENFFATNLGDTTAERQLAYGLGSNEKFVYYIDSTQTSLGVIGSTKMSSNSKIKSVKTGGVWQDAATVAAGFDETVGVQLNVVNEGNRALGGFRLYDIVPYSNYLNSSGNCSITLDTITAAGSPDFWFYTAAGPPPLSDIQNITLPSAGWVKGMPADKSTIKAFLVDFKTTQLAGGNTLTVDIGFKIPPELAGEQLANNKFSYTTGEVNASGVVANIQTFDSPQQGFTTASYYIDYVDDFAGETANWPDNDSDVLMGDASDFLKVTTQVPTRAGYSLDKWNTTASGSGTTWAANATKMFNTNDKSLELHAIWKIDSAQTITATYKLAGGNVAGSTADILQAGKKVEDTLSLPVPVRIGYTFDGWYEGASKWESTTKIQSKHITANGVTLVAKWNVDSSQKVNVRFTTVDTTHVTGMPAAQSLVAGNVISKPTNPVRAGYTLTGWKYSATPWVFTTTLDTKHFGGTAPNYAMTLEAIWEISDGTGGKLDEKIDVTFDLGGGKIGANTANVVRLGQHVESKPAIPAGVVYDGYAFVKWVDETNNTWDSSSQLNSGHMAAGSLKITAKWQIDPAQTITATYKLAGGNVAGSTADILQAGKKVEDTLTLPVPVRIGYTFDGWYEGTVKWEATTKIQSKHITANGVTLVAKWNVDNSQKVTVKFTTVDATHVTGMPAAQSLVAGNVISKPTNPVRAGYTLTGWKYSATPWVFTTTLDTKHFGGTAPNYAMTLEAIWEISDGTGGKLDEKIDVTFDLGGGKIGSNTANVVRLGQHVESKPLLPTGVVYDGYAFVKWVDESSNTWDSNSQLNSGHMAAGSLTITAKWQIDPAQTITATYKLAGGNVAGSTADILQAGKKVEDTLTLPVPVRIGYTFDGWYEGASKWESTTKIQSKHITANGVTLVAKWNVDSSQKVNVRFTTVDTTHVTGMPAAQSLVAGSVITKPTNPVRAGYTLTGWKYNATPWVFTTTLDTKHFGGTAPNYAMTLEAIWEISDGTGGKLDEKINVTFDLGGGKIGASTAAVVFADQLVEAKPIIPIGLAKDGYTFLSWREKIGTPGEKLWDSSRQLDSGHMADGALTITAKWSINPYTVSFNADGGTPAPTAVLDDFDTVFALPTVSKDGYTFKGWMNPASVVVGLAGENYTIKGDILLKAKWEINDYTLSFITESGVTPPVAMTRNYNTVIQLPDAPKTGYTLEGWYNSTYVRVGGTGDNYTIKKDEALTAKWTINSYTVTFVPAGGTTTPTAVTQNYNTTTILPNISKTGYTFKGWMNPANNVVGLAGASYTIKNDIVLTAKWEIVAYTLTFDSKGGTTPSPATITKNYQQQAGTLPVVSRSGYTFGGWFNPANQSITNTYSIEKNELIIAKWNPKTYTVTFNNNGGTTATTPASVNIVFDTNIPLLPTTGSGAPTKLGHTFVGWSTDSGATNTNNFVAGSKYAIDAAGGNLTVYAIWTQDSYSLKLNCNTPANSNTIIPVNYDSVVTLPFEGDSMAPNKTGYALGGWSNVKTGPCDYVLGDNYTHTLEADKTLFADWGAKSYQLVFDNNGGDTAANPTSKTVVFDQSVGILPKVADGTAPTKAGHTFMGWTTDNGSTNVNFNDNAIYKTDSPSGSMTVYAVWEINSYKILVETYEYDYDAIEATAVKTNSQTHNITYGTTFVATPPVISEYSFIKADPAVKIDFVANDAIIKLYYQQVTYVLDYADQVVVTVSDKFPAKDNTLSLEDFFVTGNVSVTSSAADARSFRGAGFAGNPQITNVGLNQLDYSKVTTDFSQKVTFTFTWKNGQVKTAEFAVKISDTIAPVITMPAEQRFRFINGLETVPTSEAELLSLLYAKGLSVVDNYDGQIDPIVTYVDGSFDNIKWDKAGEHGLLIGAMDSSGNLADKQKAIAVVWVVDTSDNGNGSDDDGKGSGSGGDKDSPLSGGENNNSDNKNPEGNSFDENGNLVDSKGNKLVDASKLPEGSSLNAKGQLIDSKGNLINLKGSAGGSLPRTGAIVGSSLLVVVLMALLLLLLLKKKKESAKQDKNQI